MASRRVWFGVLLVLLFVTSVVLVVAPRYSDFRAASETSEWLAVSRVLLSEIKPDLLKNVDVSGSDPRVTSALGSIPSIGDFGLRPTGDLYIRGGRNGQIILLIAERSGGDITWRCIGGSGADVVQSCRSL